MKIARLLAALLLTTSPMLFAQHAGPPLSSQAAAAKPKEKPLPNETPAPQCASHKTFMSRSLAREMAYCIILPEAYEGASENYPVLYLLHGLWGDENDWMAKTKIAEYARPLKLIIVMPEGDDSWYTNSVTDPRNRYEDYAFSDLVKEIESKYRAIPERRARFIAGLSMGGYGAMKAALKYPDEYSYAGVFSAAFGVGTKRSPFITPKVAFGDEGSATYRANDDYVLVTQADPAKLPYIFVTVGTEDGLRPSDLLMADIMRQMHIRYEYHEWPGGHDWHVWDRSARIFLMYLQAVGAVQQVSAAGR